MQLSNNFHKVLFALILAIGTLLYDITVHLYMPNTTVSISSAETKTHEGLNLCSNPIPKSNRRDLLKDIGDENFYCGYI